MPEKTARALGRGCARQVVLLAVASTAVLALFGGAVVLGALLPLPVAFEPLRPYLEWGLQIGAFLVAIGVTFVVSAVIAIRRTQGLDEAFAAVGIPGNAFFSGRAWHGTWGGRHVDAYLFRGPTLELHVESPVHTRVAVAQRSAGTLIARVLFDKPLVPCTTPGFEDLEVHADDAAWVGRFLDDPVVRGLVPKLTHDHLGPERRLLALGPDAIALRMRYLPAEEITPDHVLSWVEDLAELARRAEDVDPPAVIDAETPFERRWRTARGAVWAPLGWLTLVATVVFALVTLGFAARILIRSLS